MVSAKEGQHFGWFSFLGAVYYKLGGVSLKTLCLRRLLTLRRKDHREKSAPYWSIVLLKSEKENYSAMFPGALHVIFLEQLEGPSVWLFHSFDCPEVKSLWPWCLDCNEWALPFAVQLADGGWILLPSEHEVAVLYGPWFDFLVLPSSCLFLVC